MKYICIACDPNNPCELVCSNLERPTSCPILATNPECKWMTLLDVTLAVVLSNMEVK
jgi:hypothetical protein